MVEMTNQITPEEAEANTESVTYEIEGLQQTLVDTEFSVVTPSEGFRQELTFSLVPNFDGKIIAKNLAKSNTVEFKRLPPFELKIKLTEGYPSHDAP